MTPAQRVGLGVTGAAVLVLLGSLVLGLRGGGEGSTLPGVLGGEGPRVRVEVLNASGIPGLARAATERLRQSGYDVVYFGNGRSFAPDSSLVLDRVGTMENAASVAEAVGIGRVGSRPDTSLYLDVTVVLGRDWTGAAGCAPAADCP